MSSARANVVMRCYVCHKPDFDALMNVCDQPLYRWIAQIPAVERPVYLNREMQRIASEVMTQQAQHVEQCEAGRHISQPGPTTGLRLTIASRVAGEGVHRNKAGASLPQTTRSAQLNVSFSPGSAPPPPTQCAMLPYYYLHRVAKIGINTYPENTSVRFEGEQDANWNGTGPWEGAKVFVFWSLNDCSLARLPGFFRLSAKIQSPKVFDHWVSFKTIDNPSPPASLVARCEAFNLAAVQIETSIPFDASAPIGQRGHGWQVFDDFTHSESAQSWATGQWLESGEGWQPSDHGGYGADHAWHGEIPAALIAAGQIDGHWTHRVCVHRFQRPPTAVVVRYNGVQIEEGRSSVTPLASHYVPGATLGIARCEERVTIRTVGASKASFRILGIEPVPGFGVHVTLQVLNELHFAACIVTPFLSGINDAADAPGNSAHYASPTIWVVRNLAANAESAPIGILMPMAMYAAGDWALRDLHWRSTGAQGAYAAPLKQFPDGIYGSDSGSPCPDIGNWPPPAYKMSSSSDIPALLLAGVLPNGERIWHSVWDGTAETGRVLLNLPVHIAPGEEVFRVSDPRIASDPPAYGDQLPFVSIIEWSAQYRMSSNPETWVTQSGLQRLSLDLNAALERYGRTLTVNVAQGHPFWSAYYRKWLTVFESWSGGNVDELETWLIDQQLRPQFQASAGWRNLQTRSIKKPSLFTNVASWFKNQAPVDEPGRIHALTLIQETTQADAVEVMLMGYW